MGLRVGSHFKSKLESMTLGEKIKLAESFSKVANPVPNLSFVVGNRVRKEVRELISNLSNKSLEKTFNKDELKLLESSWCGSYARWMSDLIASSDDGYYINLNSDQATKNKTEKSYHNYLNRYLTAMNSEDKTAQEKIRLFMQPQSAQPVIDEKQVFLDLTKKECRLFSDIASKSTISLIERRIAKDVSMSATVKEILETYPKSIEILHPADRKLLKKTLEEGYKQLKSPKYAAESLLHKFTKINFDLFNSIESHAHIKNLEDRLEAILKDCNKQISLTSLEKNQLKQTVAQALAEANIEEQAVSKKLIDHCLQSYDYDITKTIFHEKLTHNRDSKKTISLIQKELEGKYQRILNDEEAWALKQFSNKIYKIMDWPFIDEGKKPTPVQAPEKPVILKETEVKKKIKKSIPSQPKQPAVDLQLSPTDLAKKECRLYADWVSKATIAMIKFRIAKGVTKKETVTEMAEIHPHALKLLTPGEHTLLTRMLGKVYKQLKSPKYASESLINKFKKINFDINNSIENHSHIKDLEDRLAAILKDCKKQIPLTSLEKDQLKQMVAQSLAEAHIEKQAQFQTLSNHALQNYDYDITRAIFNEKLSHNRDSDKTISIIKKELESKYQRVLSNEEELALKQFCNKIYKIMDWPFIDFEAILKKSKKN